jgi:GT2 family glycosyltransferase
MFNNSMPANKLAIVILNFNGRKHLETYLPSVVAHSGEHKIIVADNASADDSVAFLKGHYPQIDLIINPNNGGFAHGYNEALQHVDAEYYILLNSDVEVTPNWIEPLLAFMESNPNASGCQPIVLSYLNKDKFEHAGAAGGFLDKHYYPFCRGRIFDYVEENTGQYNSDREIFWATGACMLIRAEHYHKVGGFDASFFAHMEEIDLCWRLKQLGHSFYAIGASTVYHLGGGTLNYMSPRKTFLNFRNSLFMITKNHDGWLFPKIYMRLCLDGLAAIQFLFSGHVNHIWALLKAHISFYQNLGEMLQKRRNFRKQFNLKFNKSGLYSKSIIVDKFLRRKHLFSKLNAEDFQ